MDIEIKFFSQQIRNLREEHEWTQEELARQLGVSRQSIIAFERGRCLPSLPLAMSMADLFNLMLEDILRPTQLEQAETLEANENLMIEQDDAWHAQIHLPENIDEDEIDVQLENGILSITLPKKVQALSKVTKIKVKKAVEKSR
jgi:putative transcriptional regulator